MNPQKYRLRTEFFDVFSSLSSLRSPGVKTSSSATKKTPAKFDLQASLKKRLSYKPHTGKLKESYFGDKSAAANTTFNANSTFTLSPKKDVKQLSKQNAKAKRYIQFFFSNALISDRKYRN